MNCFLRIALLTALLLCPACARNSVDSDDELGISGTPPAVEINHDTHSVNCRNDSGQVQWSTPLDGYIGRGAPPHLLYDAERVYVTHKDGLTCLDRATGTMVWHSTGPGERMCLSGDLILATTCSIEPGGGCLVAYAVKDGAEIFRVRLPERDFDPLPIKEISNLFLVQSWDAPDGTGNAWLIDRIGAIRYHLDHQVVDAKNHGENLILLTSHAVVRLSRDGKTVWTIPFTNRQWLAGGGLQELEDGDLLAYL
jgi:hypothetical protein